MNMLPYPLSISDGDIRYDSRNGEVELSNEKGKYIITNA